MSRATVYRRRAIATSEAPRALLKRGPKTRWTDAELLGLIRDDLGATTWVGEGHRKVWARLRALKAVRTSRRRVLRLMREAKLLAPHREVRVLGPYAHDGTIIPERPNTMWGTDATAAFTTEEGQVTVFIAVDHFTAECVGIHATKIGNRFEALEPLRQAVRARYGAYGAKCVLRAMPITDSGACRSPVPDQADHRFRTKPFTRSGLIDHPGTWL